MTCATHLPLSFAGMRLIQKSKLDEKAEAIVLMMQKSLMRMASLVDNILDFARGTAGRRNHTNAIRSTASAYASAGG